MQYRNKPPSEPRQPKNPKADSDLPQERGFYWAKWQLCEEGTEDEEHFSATGLWTVVEVVPTFGEETSFDFVVDVVGYSKWQSLDNFIWAKPIKALESPQ